MNVRWMAALAAALALAGCQRAPAVHQYSFFAFGTLVELTVAGADDTRAAEARELVAAGLDRRHHDWHAWRPGPLARLNDALAAGETVEVPGPLAGILQDAYARSVQSGGLFNPALGRIVALWGFHADEPPSGPPPRPGDIDALMARRPSMPDLVLDGGRVRSTNASLQLDFGAIGKGVALRELAALLEESGLENFLINAGGDLVARGRRPDRSWRIGIRRPRGSGVLASIEVADGEAVFTSGDYERYFEHDGERFHHIIDPRTGRPARGTRSVTVVARDGGLADAAATALFVAGPGQWPETARRMGIGLVLLVADDGTVEMTPAMAERVRVIAEPAPGTRILEP